MRMKEIEDTAEELGKQTNKQTKKPSISVAYAIRRHAFGPSR